VEAAPPKISVDEMASAPQATVITMPPKGTSPRSTFEPASMPRLENRPATRLPAPIPPTSASSSGTTSPCVVAPLSKANWSTLSCTTAPSAQK
jgi:hypothetical protein